MAGETLEFPRFVFYVPGPNQAHGFTFDQVLVSDSSEYDSAIEAGYFGNLLDANDDYDTRDDKEPDPAIGSASGTVAPKKRGRPPKVKEDSNAVEERTE